VSEESKVGHPYTSCDRYDQLFPVPNGDADGAHERTPIPWGGKSHLPKRRRERTCGEGSRERQQQLSGTQGSNEKGVKRAKYQQIAISQTGRMCKRGGGEHAHSSEGDLNLGIVAYQGAGTH
jgi:hypothetical protein